MAMCPLVQASIDIEDEIFYYKYRSEIDVNNSNNQHIGNHQENIERVKAIFTRNEIYFPNRKELNDCEDCNPIFSLKATRKDWKNSFARSIKRDAKRKGQNINKHQCLKRAEQFVQTGAYKQPENRSKLINALRNEIATIGIYSLSEEPDIRHMWDRYASLGKGFCLQFKAINMFFGKAQILNYQDERVIVNSVKDDIYTQIDKIFRTKRTRWSPEKEVRIIDHDGKFGKKYFPPECLSGVLFGYNISEDDKKYIIELCEARKCPPKFYQACLEGNENIKIILPET